MEPYSEERLRSGPAELSLSFAPPLDSARLPSQEVRLRELLSDESRAVRRSIASDIAKLPSISAELGKAVLQRFVLETDAPVLQALTETLPKLPINHGDRCAVIGAMLADQRIEVRRTVLEMLRLHPETSGDLRGVLFVVSQRERSLELRELIEDTLFRIDPAALQGMELRQREIRGLIELPAKQLLPHEFFWPLLLEEDAATKVRTALEARGPSALSSNSSVAMGCYALRALTGSDVPAQQVVIEALAKGGGWSDTLSAMVVDLARTTPQAEVARYAMILILSHEVGGSDGAHAAADRLLRSRAVADGEVVARKLDRLSILCTAAKGAAWAEELLARDDPGITSSVFSALARCPQLIRPVRDRLFRIAMAASRERSIDRAEALRLLSLGLRYEGGVSGHSSKGAPEHSGALGIFEERLQSLARVLTKDLDDTVAAQALSTLGSLPTLNAASRAILVQTVRSGSEERALAATTALCSSRHIELLSAPERAELRSIAWQRAAAYDCAQAEDPMLVPCRRTFLELYLKLTPFVKTSRWVQRSCVAVIGFLLDCRTEQAVTK